MTDFFDIHSASGKTSYGNLTICIGGVGSGDASSTSGIRVDAELPAGQVLAVFSGFGQIESGGLNLINKADRSSLTCCECDFLRIGAGTGVHSINGAVCMSQLLNIDSSHGETCNRNFAVGISGMRTGN